MVGVLTANPTLRSLKAEGSGLPKAAAASLGDDVMTTASTVHNAKHSEDLKPL